MSERDSETTDITYIVLFYVVLFNLLALSRERGKVHHIVLSYLNDAYVIHNNVASATG